MSSKFSQVATDLQLHYAMRTLFTYWATCTIEYTIFQEMQIPESLLVQKVKNKTVKFTAQQENQMHLLYYY